ncbi:acylneuraminate cytidylyltransferase family protein [Roseibaca sp. V10]|uniref:Acylneuraminate cytidylyltransferase family protein n=1 Tax=Roseinatronobacter domitianus TaxID=2940293 RepID=A0ABT0M2S4_9RHOB|nr:acylneuraminate cytidylyltransferase family protein [Roseibaca domitiana]MCL1629148.1 acylneuraminate cytidylyltransferase family protein [Roseibaca domitiana]
MTAPCLAIVPLRAGSKGLPGKNTRLLAGRPLYAHALEQARAAGISPALVTSDIAELASAELGPGARFAPRPAHLAQDTTPMDAVLDHVLTHDAPGPATIVLLQATTPLRAPQDIARAIALHATGEHALVMSATRAESGVLKWGTAENGRFVPLSRDAAHCFTNRAELPPVYRPDGAVYVFDADAYRRAGSLGALAVHGVGMVETPLDRAFDIDTLADFSRVEALLEARA